MVWDELPRPECASAEGVKGHVLMTVHCGLHVSDTCKKVGVIVFVKKY